MQAAIQAVFSGSQASRHSIQGGASLIARGSAAPGRAGDAARHRSGAYRSPAAAWASLPSASALAGDAELGGQAAVGAARRRREGPPGDDQLAALVNLGQQFRGQPGQAGIGQQPACEQPQVKIPDMIPGSGDVRREPLRCGSQRGAGPRPCAPPARRLPRRQRPGQPAACRARGPTMAEGAHEAGRRALTAGRTSPMPPMPAEGLSRSARQRRGVLLPGAWLPRVPGRPGSARPRGLVPMVPSGVPGALGGPRCSARSWPGPGRGNRGRGRWRDVHAAAVHSALRPRPAVAEWASQALKGPPGSRQPERLVGAAATFPDAE